MKIIHHRSVAVLAILLAATSALGMPRSPGPPWPAIGMSFHEGFDQPYGFGTNQTIDASTWVEGWSGWALNRQTTTVTPWTVPMVVSNSFRIDPERGAIRFWYRPNFNTGNGPGGSTTLATLFSAQGNTEAIWWSLVVSADGSEVQLICQTESGPQGCLAAEVSWTEGEWHLITVGYTPTNSALFIDGGRVCEGNGLATVPTQVTPYTALVIGSTASGTDTAKGQIEELCIFSGRNRFRQITGSIFGLSELSDIGNYYTNLGPVAALGPISDEEIAARRELAAKLKAEREALGLEEEGGGGMQMMILGGTTECITNSPLYITNIVAWFDTNTLWTVQFDIQGTNSPADVFTTTNLSGNSITNSHWTWLERGPSCYTYQYTNQTNTGGFYILGTMQDSDSDGLTDAFEKLVSKTRPDLWDTDGDGISDREEVILGTNPLVNEIALTSGRLNYQYNANGWLTNASGIWSKGIGLDAEGNVTGVTP